MKKYFILALVFFVSTFIYAETSFCLGLSFPNADYKINEKGYTTINDFGFDFNLSLLYAVTGRKVGFATIGSFDAGFSNTNSFDVPESAINFDMLVGLGLAIFPVDRLTLALTADVGVKYSDFKISSKTDKDETFYFFSLFEGPDLTVVLKLNETLGLYGSIAYHWLAGFNHINNGHTGGEIVPMIGISWTF